MRRAVPASGQTKEHCTLLKIAKYSLTRNTDYNFPQNRILKKKLQFGLDNHPGDVLLKES